MPTSSSVSDLIAPVSGWPVAETISIELETVRRAAAGEARAQAWLVQRAMSPVRRVCRSLCNTAADADDVAQNALIEVLRSAKTFRGLAPLEAWVARIATRVALRHVTRERRLQQSVVNDTPQSLPADLGPERMAELMPNDLRNYLARLPGPQRSALVMRYALGYSIDEIGELTDVSRNTVKARLRLGSAALRKMVRRDLNLRGSRHGDGHEHR